MVDISNISFFDPSAPSQESIARQRKLAELLQAQSMQQSDPAAAAPGSGPYGGLVVPQGPLSGLNKLAAALSGAYINKQSDEQAKALKQSDAAALGRILSAGDAKPLDPSFVGPPTAAQRGGGGFNSIMAQAAQEAQNNPDLMPIAQQIGLAGVESKLKAEQPYDLAMGTTRMSGATNKPIASVGLFGGMTGGAGQTTQGGNSGLSGDDFLKTLPPQASSLIKSYASGKLPISPMMVRTPQGMQLLSAISQYDPTFDAVNYNARNKARMDLTSGPTSRNIKSVETAFNTLAQAKDASDKLGGVNNMSVLTGPLNAAEVAYKGFSNDPMLNTYNNLAKAAADETTKAITATGGTGADRNTREQLYRAGQSPEARNASLQASAQELISRLAPNLDLYNKTMGNMSEFKDPMELLSPQAQKNYQKLVGTPAAQPQGQQVPQPGAVENGYQFMGGDPSNQASWKKVQ